MRLPWQGRKDLDESARKVRGKLAEAIAENSVMRHRLDQRSKEGGVSSVLDDLFKRMDEGHSRG